uniref:WAP domain-containing protein n=1 Tax=Heligmosomoides polygyrus TaxID=6339 RepID=A0A183GME8_HELPZ
LCPGTNTVPFDQERCDPNRRSQCPAGFTCRRHCPNAPTVIHGVGFEILLQHVLLPSKLPRQAGLEPASSDFREAMFALHHRRCLTAHNIRDILGVRRHPPVIRVKKYCTFEDALTLESKAGGSHFSSLIRLKVLSLKCCQRELNKW